MYKFTGAAANTGIVQLEITYAAAIPNTTDFVESFVGRGAVTRLIPVLIHAKNDL